MYDTITVSLKQSQVPNVNLYAKLKNNHNIIKEPQSNSNPGSYYVGNLRNMRIYYNYNFRQEMVTITGSLCKFLLGNNFDILTRAGAEEAIKELSRALGFDISTAKVTHLDFGSTYMTKYPANIYIAHLGEYKRSPRVPCPNGAYYSYNPKSRKQLYFYDKKAEAKHNGTAIPIQYANRECTRFELRLKNRVASQTGEKEVIAAMLYNRVFFDKMCDMYLAEYKAVRKISDMIANPKILLNRKQRNMFKTALEVEKFGGLNKALEMVTELGKWGKLKPPTVTYIKKRYKEVTNVNTAGFMVKNKAIQELNRKIERRVRRVKARP